MKLDEFISIECMWCLDTNLGAQSTLSAIISLYVDVFFRTQALGFRHVLMSGSGSTIFCIGDASCGGSWVEAFSKKWDALVVETSFINRCTDRDTWYMPPDVPRA